MEKNSGYIYSNNEIDLYGAHYYINCGMSLGTTCGDIQNPASYKDCGLSSLDSNSCCYVGYKEQTSCVWLGTPDTGIFEYNGITIICGAKLNNFHFNLLILTLFLILIF
jgi:hypothetical protein